MSRIVRSMARWAGGNWEYIVFAAFFLLWFLCRLKPIVAHQCLTMAQQQLVSGLLSEHIRMQITVAGVLITFSVGLITYLQKNAATFHETDLKIARSRSIQSLVLMFLCILMGTWNLASLPDLALRHNYFDVTPPARCRQNFFNVNYNHAVVALFRAQMVLFLIGLVRISRTAWKVHSGKDKTQTPSDVPSQSGTGS